MKKKWLSIFLVLAMVLGMMPAMAFADDATLVVDSSKFELIGDRDGDDVYLYEADLTGITTIDFSQAYPDFDPDEYCFIMGCSNNYSTYVDEPLITDIPLYEIDDDYFDDTYTPLEAYKDLDFSEYFGFVISVDGMEHVIIPKELKNNNEGSATLVVDSSKFELIGDRDGDDVYLYKADLTGITTIDFSQAYPDFDPDEYCFIMGCSNNYSTYVDEPLITDIPLYEIDEDYFDDTYTPLEAYKELDFSECYGFVVSVDGMEHVIIPKDLSTFSLGGGDQAPSFELSAGKVVSVKEDGYTDSYMGSADLYTVEVPFGTNSLTVDLEKACISYSYSAPGNYLGTVTDTAAESIKVKADEEGSLPPYITIQNPYNEDWSGGELLFAIKFEMTYTFEVSVDGTAVPVSEVEKDGYTYDDYYKGDVIVNLYTVELPEGTEQVDIKTSDPALAYNYMTDGKTWLGGLYDSSTSSGSMYTGLTSFTVDVDTNGDGEADVIQIQLPYNTDYSGGDLLYAITFDVAQPEEPDYSFEVTAGTETLEVAETRTGGYTYYDYASDSNLTADVYVMETPEGTDTVTITVNGKVLFYNYTEDANYISGGYASEDPSDPLYTGVDSQEITIDADGDGAADYIQVQKPYNTDWSGGEILYVITFDLQSEEPVEEPSEVDIDELIAKIAAGYAAESALDDWAIMDMSAYSKLDPKSPNKVASAVIQNYINDAAAKAAAETAPKESDLAKMVLALQSAGYDPQKLYEADSEEAISLIELLNEKDHSADSWTATYVLASYAQTSATKEKGKAIVEAVLATQNDDGSFESWGSKIDATANMIAGLAFYADDAEVKQAIDRAVEFLAAAQLDDGTFDSYGYGPDANTAAIVVIGLSAAGVDPATDERFVKDGFSALDGLLVYALEDNSGFGYQDNTTLNASATEQGFRALIAAATVAKTKKAYDIYDFSGNSPLEEAKATGEAQPVTPDDPTGDDIKVRVTVQPQEGYWLQNYSVTIPGEDAKAYHALVKAFDENGIEYKIKNGNYIYELTYDGTTLGEFDGGPNSGWLYKVGSVLPTVGVSDYSIKNGDRITFYYTNDWTQDPDAASNAGLKDEVSEEEVVDNPDTPMGGYVADRFIDVSETDWFNDAVEYAVEHDIMTGTGETTFSPQRTLSRGMLAAMLYSLEGAPEEDGKTDYTDVEPTDWFAKGVEWVTENGIANGYGERFGPNDDITREQLVVMLYGYAKMKGYELVAGEDLSAYSDAGEISDYAKEAMAWAKAAGLVTGRSADTLAPKGTATRAEAATILMNFMKNVAKIEDKPEDTEGSGE